jgi:hypothetical protein
MTSLSIGSNPIPSTEFQAVSTASRKPGTFVQVKTKAAFEDGRSDNLKQ